VEFPRPKKNSSSSPARELHAVKNEGHFIRRGGHAALNGIYVSGRHRADARDCVACGAQHGFELVARDQPACEVSGIAGIDFLHGGVRLAHFVDFSAQGCGKCEQGFAQALPGSLHHKKSHTLAGAALGAGARSIQLQDSKRENIFDGGGVFAGRGG
jgi:hypothetical protein